MPLSGEWRKINAETVETLPQAHAVFEIGSLVRSVLYIGGESSTDLRSCVRGALANPRLRMRAHCLRYELSDDPHGRAGQLLAEYRASHDGAAPSEQPRTAASLRALTSPPGLRPPSASEGADRPADTSLFLRARTVA